VRGTAETFLDVHFEDKKPGPDSGPGCLIVFQIFSSSSLLLSSLELSDTKLYEP